MSELSSIPIVQGASLEAAAGWFFEHSADGFAISRGGRILTANAAWCAITRCSQQEAVGMTAHDLMHPEDSGTYARTEAMLAAIGKVEFEARLRSCDDDWVWVRMSVKRGPDGYAMIVVHDLTAERKGIEEAREASEASDLLRSAAGVIAWRFDPDGNYYVSDISFASLGEDDVGPGRHIPAAQVVAIVHPEDRPLFLKLIEDSIRTGAPGELTYRRMRSAGAWINLRLSWRGSKQGASGKWELIGIAQDVTELSRARDAALRGEEEARAANEVKSQFIANMSHELRTPLNGVLGALHVLGREPLSADGQKLRAEGAACGTMLSTLVDHVLDFSAIERAQLELSVETVDGVSLINGVAEMLRPEAEAKGLFLRVDAAALPGPVEVDPSRLRQILFNLIGNASKFTLQGGIDVKAVGRGSGADHRLRVEVRDTGVGISEEATTQLFSPFQQADGSSTRRFGAAAWACRSAAASPNSWMARSTSRAASDGARPSGSTSPRRSLLKRMKNRTPRRRTFTSWSSTTTPPTAWSRPGSRGPGRFGGNGRRRRPGRARRPTRRLRSDLHGHPDAILDGIEAAKLIRGMPGPAGQTPILAMTANVAPHQLVEYQEAGMEGLVPKPLSPTQLTAEIARTMETSKRSTRASRASPSRGRGSSAGPRSRG